MIEAPTIFAIRPLWFEPFLQQIKQELGYAININKYNQLLAWANDNAWSKPGEPMHRLYTVCKMLFLENIDHEARFTELFWNYIVDELAYERTLIKKTGTSTAPVDEKSRPAAATSLTPEPGESVNSEETVREPPDVDEQDSIPGKQYLNLEIPIEETATTKSPGSPTASRFLFSDAWMPLTKREMMHGWRNLRKKEGYRPGRQLDVAATVEQIAREGLLIDPVYEMERVNSDDLLLILVDRKGSMTPFHKLSDQLIATAIKGGGHRHAQVYYFYNCPVDYVYKNPNLTGPVRLDQLYSRIRADHTNVMIISDAGAARGNFNKERVKKMQEFLRGTAEKDGLHKRALFVAWLNPVPRHRWPNTTAGRLAADPATPMYPLMENGYINFLQAIDKLMGK